MKGNETKKRLVKRLAALTILLLDVGIYWHVWNGYYNRLIEFPFWRRGNWLMVALYAVLLAFFLHTYGGFRIGYLKAENLIWSQFLSLIIVNVITYVQIALLDKRFHTPDTMLLMTAAEAFISIVWVLLFQSLYRRLFPPRRMLLIFSDRPAFHLMEKIHSREDKYYLAGAIHISVGVEKIMEMLKDYDAAIIGDIPAEVRNTLMKLCFDRNIRTYSVPKISDILIKSSEELDIFDSPLLLSRNEGLQLDQRIAKRFMDLLFSGAGLILSSPLFFLIAVSIKLTDGGPVFYKQKRLTRNGQEFMIYKFRTMVQNAEKMGARLASEHDDRILPVGKLLRRTRLDELPQLWNIWKGEMSLVGPRPERPELAAEIERELPEFRFRLKMKAGLTGYAQIYGKYNTTSYDKLKLDLHYIQNYSVLLDLKLILMTPKIMLLKESTEGVGESGRADVS